MCVEIPKAGYDDMLSAPPGEDSAGMRAKVCASMEIQEERYRGSAYRYNSDLDGEGISRYCAMDREAEELSLIHILPMYQDMPARKRSSLSTHW